MSSPADRVRQHQNGAEPQGIPEIPDGMYLRGEERPLQKHGVDLPPAVLRQAVSQGRLLHSPAQQSNVVIFHPVTSFWMPHPMKKEKKG